MLRVIMVKFNCGSLVLSGPLWSWHQILHWGCNSLVPWRVHHPLRCKGICHHGNLAWRINMAWSIIFNPFTFTIIHEVSMGLLGQVCHKSISIEKGNLWDHTNHAQVLKRDQVNLAYSSIRMTENRRVLLSQDILIEITLLSNLFTVAVPVEKLWAMIVQSLSLSLSLSHKP